jgi:hypothetical protein
MSDHMRIQVATLAGVDLDSRRTRRTNPVRIVRGLLVAFDDRNREARPKIVDRPHQKRCVTGARTGDEV